MAVSRMVVVELSGATLDLLVPWAREGRLPGFARLFAEGTHGALRRDADAPGLGADARVWRVVTAHGRRIGLLRPRFAQDGATLDPRWTIVSDVPADASPSTDLHTLRDRIFDLQRRQIAEALRLIEAGERDLVWIGFPLVATVERMFWHFMDSSHPAHAHSRELGDTVLQFHRVLDEGLRQIMQQLDASDHVLVVSERGACGLDGHFSVERWLAERGYLGVAECRRESNGIGLEIYALVRALRRSGLGWLPTLGSHSARTKSPSADVRPVQAAAAIDWSATRVFGTGGAMGGLRVNLRGRDPHGIVTAADLDRVIGEVTEALLGVIDPRNGRPVIRAVHRRDVSSGIARDDAPDLVIEPHARYAVVATGGAASVIVETGRAPGTATAHLAGDGLIALRGPGVRRDAVLPALDRAAVAPTMLHLLGVQVQGDVEGRVATALLDDTMAASHGPHEPRDGAVPGSAGMRGAASTLEGIGYP